MRVGFWWENLKVWERLKCLDIIRRTILEWKLKVIKWNVVDWSCVAKDTVHWLFFVNTGFLTSRETSSFL
jgi:hypothetical protein